MPAMPLSPDLAERCSTMNLSLSATFRHASGDRNHPPRDPVTFAKTPLAPLPQCARNPRAAHQVIDRSLRCFVGRVLHTTKTVFAPISPTTATMPGPFTSKSFSATLPNSIAARYRKALQKHPFLLFGLPFMATIVAGSFMLTPATALRYERYDRKNQQISHEEAMGLRQERRKVNMKDEYYVSASVLRDNLLGTSRWSSCSGTVTDMFAEITSERSRRLGAAACQAIARRARRHACVKQLYKSIG